MLRYAWNIDKHIIQIVQILSPTQTFAPNVTDWLNYSKLIHNGSLNVIYKVKSMTQPSIT